MKNGMNKVAILMGVLAMFVAQTSWAMEHHHQQMQEEQGDMAGHAGHDNLDMSGDMKSGHEHMMHDSGEADTQDQSFMVTQEVDGYTVTFLVNHT